MGEETLTMYSARCLGTEVTLIGSHEIDVSRERPTEMPEVPERSHLICDVFIARANAHRFFKIEDLAALQYFWDLVYDPREGLERAELLLYAAEGYKTVHGKTSPALSG